MKQHGCHAKTSIVTMVGNDIMESECNIQERVSKKNSRMESMKKYTRTFVAVPLPILWNGSTVSATAGYFLESRVATVLEFQRHFRNEDLKTAISLLKNKDDRVAKGKISLLRRVGHINIFKGQKLLPLQSRVCRRIVVFPVLVPAITTGLIL
jgi:hypothetical protein